MQTAFRSSLALAALAAGVASQHTFAELSRGHIPVPAVTTEPFVLADFDGDGDLDGVREGAVFENFGDACFALRHRLRGFQAGLIVTAADVDGDGYADLVELGRLEVYATIHYGDGRFGFPTSHGPFRLSRDWRPVHVADFDGDGRDDILCKTDYGHLALLVHDASSGLREVPVPSVAQSASARSLIFDVDGDGDLDILFLPGSLLRNDGSGNLTHDPLGVVTGIGGAITKRGAVGDLDGDGDLDVVQTNLFGHEELYNQGGRLVGSPMTIATQAGSAVGLVDVDGDGRAELLWGSPIELYRGRSNWQPVPGATPTTTSPAELRIIDVDGDGHADVLGEDTMLWLSDGRGGFVDASATALELACLDWMRPRQSAWADFDGDGDVDGIGELHSWLGAGAGEVLAVNRGDGTFEHSPGRPLPAVGFAIQGLHTADFDGDGAPDLLATGYPNHWAQLRNRGDGTFVVAGSGVVFSTFGEPMLVDPDSDGDIDAVWGGTGGIEMLENDGSGNLTPRNLLTSAALYRLAFGDLDGDGDQDIVAVGLGAIGTNVIAFFRNASGGYAGPFPTNANSNVAGMKLVDVDLDGDLDLLASRGAAPLALLLNDGTGTFTDVSATHMISHTVWPAGHLPLVGDLDLDGDPDVVCGKVVLENRGGVFHASRSLRHVYHFTDLYGQDQAEALVDLDGDGDLDVVGFGMRAVQNLHRQVHAPYLARVGRRYTLRIFCQPGYLPTPASAFAILGVQETSVPLAAFGVLRVVPMLVTPTLAIPTVGSIDLTFRLPNDARLVGVDLYGQAVVVPPGGAPRLTNHTHDVVF